MKKFITLECDLSRVNLSESPDTEVFSFVWENNKRSSLIFVSSVILNAADGIRQV